MSAILKMLQNRAVEVELKSEVVEFGVASDMEKRVKQMAKAESDFNKAGNILKTAKKKEDDMASDFKFSIDQAEETLNEFAKQAKELGIDPNKQSAYKALKGSIFGNKNALKNRGLK